ncbi:uncharacterized protein LOC128883980 [Hylaeus volcanicus]|uniref:uncharacterized protein LOC128883980 n=1 Tax=Hylaeus volcanicus TaxID=313075 RepID=UPI0023B7FF26|nr:uncharacterized protein LOC128883980 [Hylaeus volcanicus]
MVLTIIYFLLTCVCLILTYIVYTFAVSPKRIRLSGTNNNSQVTCTAQTSKIKKRNVRHKKNQGNVEIQKITTDCPVYDTCCSKYIKPFSYPISALCLNKSGTQLFAASTNSCARCYNVENTFKSDSPKKSSYIELKLNNDTIIAADFSYSCNSPYIFAGTEYSGKLIKLKIDDCKENRLGQLTMEKESDSMVFSQHRVFWLNASQGQWIVVGADDNFTEIKIYNYQLSLLNTLDTKQIKNFQLAFSASNYFASAAWVAGIKVQKISAQKEEYKKCEKVMDILTPCGTTALAFSPTNTRLIVASKQNDLYLYNIDVRYLLGEDPHLLVKKHITMDAHFTHFDQLFYTSNEEAIIGICLAHILFLRSDSLSIIKFVPHAHSSVITRVLPLPSSNSVITVAINDHSPSLWSHE